MSNFTLNWRNWSWKLALLFALVLSVFSLSQITVSADDDQFRYKFPCLPADACYVTTLAHVGNAFDFDPRGGCGPQGSLCAGLIPAVSEGTFVRYETQSTSCTGVGLGRLAVIDDIYGNRLKYAHLSVFGSLVPGQRVMQGDIVGIEGNTGNTLNCQYHLHLEGISTTSYIDGVATSSITAGPTLYTSTNSQVGSTDPSNAPGFAIRQVFKDFGNAFGPGGSSWGLFGWTADLNPVHQGCAPNSFCQLYVHGELDPQSGPWGFVQNFMKHPETFEYEDVPKGSG